MTERAESLDTLARIREGNLAWRARGRSAGLELAPIGAKREVAVVCCSDLGIAPEVAFDRRFGELLVVQTPGPVVDEAVVTSLRYGVEVLGVRLIVVLAHEGCASLREGDGSLDRRPSRFLECVDGALREARAAGAEAARENAMIQSRHVESGLAGATLVVPAVLRADGELELLDEPGRELLVNQG